MRNSTWSNDHQILFLNSRRVIINEVEYKWKSLGERKIGIRKTVNKTYDEYEFDENGKCGQMQNSSCIIVLRGEHVIQLSDC